MAVKRWNGTTWDIYAGADTSPGFAATDGRSGRRTYVGANTPTAPVDGDIWIDQDTATNAIPASAFDAKGDLMVGTGPDTYTRQAVGTDGQVLVADSSQADGVLWSHTPSRQGLINVVPTSVSVGSGSASVGANGGVTFTGVNPITINGCFNSAYENYKIIVSCQQNSSNADWAFTTTSSGTVAASTWGAAGVSAFAATSGALFATNAQNAASIQIAASGNSTYSRCNIDIFSPALSVPTALTNLFMSGFSGAGTNTGGFINGYHNTALAYDGFRITPTSGTITGTVRVYGYNNGA
jgi:hypothetical protein